MVLALENACPATAIVPEQDRKGKRLSALRLLTEPFPPSDAKVAAAVGLERTTVWRLRKMLEEKGIEYAGKDGRARNGRKVLYGKAYARIEELKRQNPRYGGRELWFYLTGEEGFAESELPCIASIDAYLSNKKMTNKPLTGKTDKRHYLTDYTKEPLSRVGCDTVYPFRCKHGQQFQVLSFRDYWTGAVYCEPFPYNLKTAFMDGLDQRAFAGSFLRFVSHIGVPHVLVLDNGAGQITAHGVLPEIARWCINLGVIMEWEPYGRPWKNGASERWNRDLLKWWGDLGSTVKSLEEGFKLIRQRALSVTRRWPRKQLGNRPASSVIPVRDWPVEGLEAGWLRCEPLGRQGLIQDGVLRMQREVEQNGFVQLHGNDHMFVSDMLVGGYVRVEFQVRADGQPSVGSVRDGKGNLVATFQHYMNAERPQGTPLVVNVKNYMFAGDNDVRRQNFSQDVHNAEIHRAMKRQRASSVYTATGSVNPYKRSE